MLFYKERDSGRGIIFLIKQKQRQETEEQEAKKAMIHTLNNDTIAAVSTALSPLIRRMPIPELVSAVETAAMVSLFSV